jgi:hypothetical protein
VELAPELCQPPEHTSRITVMHTDHETTLGS